MASDDITQQLEEWKQKYYQSITDFENQQRYDDMYKQVPADKCHLQDQKQIRHCR